MFQSYVDQFSQTPVTTDFPSLLQVDLSVTGSIVLEWGQINPNTLYPFSQTIFVTNSNNTPDLKITLPNATYGSLPQQCTFINKGHQPFAVFNVSGEATLDVPSGTAVSVLLGDNSTPEGLWYAYQLGATYTNQDVASLAGAGLEAFPFINPLSLNVSMHVTETTQALTELTGENRAQYFIIGAAATDPVSFYCPSSETINNGFYFGIYNASANPCTVNANAYQQFVVADNPNPYSFVLSSSESATFVWSGSYWIPMGYGRPNETITSFSGKEISLSPATSSYVLTREDLKNNALFFDAGFPDPKTQFTIDFSQASGTVNLYQCINNTNITLTLAASASSSDIILLPPDNSMFVTYASTQLLPTNDFVSSNKFYLNSGSVENPSLTFLKAPLSGLSLTAGADISQSGQINVSIDGKRTVSFSQGQMLLQSGTTNRPALAFSSNQSAGFAYTDALTDVKSTNPTLYIVMNGSVLFQAAIDPNNLENSITTLTGNLTISGTLNLGKPLGLESGGTSASDRISACNNILPKPIGAGSFPYYNGINWTSSVAPDPSALGQFVYWGGAGVGWTLSKAPGLGSIPWWNQDYWEFLTPDNAVAGNFSGIAIWNGETLSWEYLPTPTLTNKTYRLIKMPGVGSTAKIMWQQIT